MRMTWASALPPFFTICGPLVIPLALGELNWIGHCQQRIAGINPYKRYSPETMNSSDYKIHRRIGDLALVEPFLRTFVIGI